MLSLETRAIYMLNPFNETFYTYASYVHNGHTCVPDIDDAFFLVYISKDVQNEQIYKPDYCVMKQVYGDHSM